MPPLRVHPHGHGSRGRRRRGVRQPAALLPDSRRRRRVPRGGGARPDEQQQAGVLVYQAPGREATGCSLHGEWRRTVKDLINWRGDKGRETSRTSKSLGHCRCVLPWHRCCCSRTNAFSDPSLNARVCTRSDESHTPRQSIFCACCTSTDDRSSVLFPPTTSAPFLILVLARGFFFRQPEQLPEVVGTAMLFDILNRVVDT